MFERFAEALKFASEIHVLQRRKGYRKVPYINHPIKVVHILISIGGENDEEILAAALLHDVLEDSDTSPETMKQKFGERVTSIVLEVTDDMNLPYDQRKQLQISHAPRLSAEAKRIKIADKIANVQDIMSLPLTWSKARKQKYIDFSERVVDGCRGINSGLEQAFDALLKEAKVKLS